MPEKPELVYPIYARGLPALRIDWERFGTDLRRERERRGLTVRQFEALTGITHSTISRIERHSQACTSEAFMTIANVMGKDPVSYTSRRPPAFTRGTARPD
jgi:transcriptional regulator with XRE-family HTH domain